MIGKVRANLKADRFVQRGPGKMASPRMAVAHSHSTDRLPLGTTAAMVRGVVLTVTVNGEAVVALTLTLAGKEHLAPAGAPVQFRVAAPAK